MVLVSALQLQQSASGAVAGSPMSLMPRSQRTLLGAQKKKKVHALENMSAPLDVQSKGHNSSEEVVSDGRSEQKDAMMMPAKDVVEGVVVVVSSALDDDSAADTAEEEEEESVVNEKFANVPFNNLSCEFGIREFRPGKPWSAIRELHRTLDPQRDVVERSACQTAAGRALWNHVIHDPLAEVLAGDSFLSSLQEKMKKDWQSNAREVPGVMLAVRTLWFDSRLSQALNRFPPYCTPQVVLLGAGMCVLLLHSSSSIFPLLSHTCQVHEGDVFPNKFMEREREDVLGCDRYQFALFLHWGEVSLWQASSSLNKVQVRQCLSTKSYNTHVQEWTPEHIA